LYTPLRSLKEGNWFKLICGASFQHLPDIRNLTLAYTLAGADCIDVAADPAVIGAARNGMQAAAVIFSRGREREAAVQEIPWLMVSLNDGEDPHFRKAEFNSDCCPPDCMRPCEATCPAQAIAFSTASGGFSGVIDSRCYGCGRCLPLCPIQQISTRSHTATPDTLPALLELVDAVEIHTRVGHWQGFKRLWSAIAPSVRSLKLIAISCPDGEGLIDYLQTLHNYMSPLPCPVIWQTDGRPMSGDIGAGTTRSAIKLGQKVLAANLPGYVQLAGGTNNYTVPKLRALGLLQCEDLASTRHIAGVAYGSYARVLLAPVLDQLEPTEDRLSLSQSDLFSPITEPKAGQFRMTDGVRVVNLAESSSIHLNSLHPTYLEAFPDLLEKAVALAASLVSQLKVPSAAQISASAKRRGDRPTPPAVAFPF